MTTRFGIVIGLYFVLACVQAAHAQTGVIQQTPVNRLDVQVATGYSNGFETGTGDVLALSGQVSATTAAGETITGTRSLKLQGSATYAQFRPEVLALLPNTSYGLNLRYRYLAAGRVGIVLRTPGAGAAEYAAIGELPASPGDGASSWTFTTPGASGATLLLYSLGASVVIDDLSIVTQRVRVSRAELPLVKAAFPRLGDYMLLDPATIAGLHGTNPAQAEELASRYDLLVGPSFDNSQWAATWIGRLRQRNPNMVILPYKQAFMAQFENTVGLQRQFNQGLASEWFMLSPTGDRLAEAAFPQNVQLDHTAFGPRINGQTVAEYSSTFLARNVLSTGLWNGILYDQAEWYVNPLLGEPTPPIDVDRNGSADSFASLQRAWADGFTSFFRTIRRQFGSTQLSIGNAGEIPANPASLRSVNGWVAEIANPYPTNAAGDWVTDLASGWYRLAGNYLLAGSEGRAPQVSLLQFTGVGLGTYSGSASPNGAPMRDFTLEPRDYRRMRLGLTTALLGNGFFEYDLVDNTTPAQWFDEYALDATGRPTTAASGKGYLGQPLGDAAEVGNGGTVLFSLDFESAALPPNVFIGPGRFTTSAAEVLSGSSSYVVSKAGAGDFSWFVWATGKLVSGRTYHLRGDYRILSYAPQEYRGFLGLGFMDHAGAMGLSRGGFLFAQDTAGAGQQGTLRAAIKATSSADSVFGGLFDVGTVAFDNIQLVEGGGGVWRRDFERGIVLVNPTPEAITLTQAQVAGALSRTGIRRLSGTQDPAWNNGAAVSSGITIPSGDGIVLLADSVAARALTAPVGLKATPGNGTATLAWSSVPAYAAGYEVRYGEDPLALTRLAAAGRKPSLVLEDLQPGATYTVRVAAFDFLGRIGSPSAPVTFTVPGTLPNRPAFVTPTALAPGSVVTITGTSLADGTVQLSAPYATRAAGTRVEVNGIEALLHAVSPTSITFVVPTQIAGNQAVLSVIRGTTAGIERLVPTGGGAVQELAAPQRVRVVATAAQ